MVIAVDFDGTLVENEVYPYTSKLVFKKCDLKNDMTNSKIKMPNKKNYKIK